ncbi:50S ribosomal protein L23 [candidate division KSB1 bacterium]|nr:50S ribosomal protein L23 [candidate division KSB1 bacterium]
MNKTFQIIQRPLLTEKITNLAELNNQYAFEIVKNINKIEIKKAIEKRFNVTVLSVRTMLVRGKKRRMGRFEGKRAQWKKAIVSLKEGDTIDFVEGSD